jgi:outer membrane protein assembly factor BamB
MTSPRRLGGSLFLAAGLFLLGVTGPDAHARRQDVKKETRKQEAQPAPAAQPVPKAAPPAIPPVAAPAQPPPVPVPAPPILLPGGGRGPRGAPRPSDEKPAFSDAVTLPTNREARNLIQAAQDYIKRKDWHTAAQCLQSLLESKDDSFLEVKRKEGEQEVTVKVSVRVEANRLIGELPSDGRETYEVLYGQTAQGRLQEALNKGDPQILAEVAQRFQHTKAGTEATHLLGTYYLDRGAYPMAALCFERLLAQPDADKLSFKILFRAAIAFRRAGEAGQAERTWKKLADKAARTDMVLGKQRVTLDQLRREYERDAGAPQLAALYDWPVFRGNASRTAQGVGSTAFLDPRWQQAMTPPPRDLDEKGEDLDQANKLKEYLQLAFASMENKPVLPAFFPVAADGKLIARTYDGVYAFSLKDNDALDPPMKAGELIWATNAQGGLHGMLRAADSKRATLDQWYRGHYLQNNVGPLGVFFENALVGTLSHDNQRVYFVDDLAVPPHSGMIYNMNFGGQVHYGPFVNEVHFNRLTAVDLETGKLRWTLGGRSNSAGPGAEDDANAGTAARLLDTFFLGPPLPQAGKLYVLTEKNAELRLVCLDPAKSDAQGVPELAWVQSLGTANNRLPQDSLRRLQAAHLAYADGILVCPTNAGAILGVDLLSRSLVWAHSYREGNANQQAEEMQQMMRFGGGRRIFMANGMILPSGPPVQDRWRPSAPAIQNGKVVFTAHDGVSVHCLNLRDGRLLGKAPRDDANDLYLAGVFGDRIVIVGKEFTRALSLDALSKGQVKELWKVATGMPSGQGTASEDVYYLPVKVGAKSREPEIAAINLATGAVTQAKSRKRQVPGNLVFAEGDLISQTALEITAFPQLKLKIAEMNRLLAKNPQDPVGLTERGELYLDKGDLTGAVADLRASLANKPPADTRTKARTKLHEALTDLLQKDFPAAEQYLDEYKDLCKVDVPADADAATKQKLADEQLRRDANYLSLLGRGREQQGRLLEAFEAYERFGTLNGNKELVSDVVEPNTRSRPDVWSRGRIQAMLAKATPQQRKELDDEIARRWRKLRDAKDLDELRQFVAVFGSQFGTGKEARLQLVERLLSGASPELLTEAEKNLLELSSATQRREDPAHAARAVEALVRLSVRRGLYEDAVRYYRQLGTEFASVAVRDGKTGADLFNELLTDKRFLPYLEPLKVSWQGRFQATDFAGQFGVPSTSLTVEPEGELLPFFRQYRIALDVSAPQGNNVWSLRLIDRATGAERWKHYNLPAAYYFTQQGPAVKPLRYAFARGHLLVLHLNQFVYAFDLAERKELWKFNLFGKNPLLNNQPANNMLLDDGRLYVAHPDSRREQVGQVGVVESSYVCVQTREGLVALDPARPGPSVLWAKGDVPVRAQVFGDERHVYVVDAGTADAPINPPKVQALRAQDGVSVPVPDFGPLYAKRLWALGRSLLVSEDGAAGRRFRLYDVQTGQDVWQRTFAAGSLVLKSEDPHLTGVLEPDRKLTLLDARTGDVLLTAAVPGDPADRPEEGHLVADADHYYVALNRKSEERMQSSSNFSYGIRSLKVNGPVVALGRVSGQLEWVCDFLPHQWLLLEQMSDLPLLLFTSSYSKFGNAGAERLGVKVTGVDKRTGKLLYDKEFSTGSQFLAVTANPRDGIIELLRHDLKVRFTLEAAEARHEDRPATGAAYLPPAPGGE